MIWSIRKKPEAKEISKQIVKEQKRLEKVTFKILFDLE